MTSSAAAQKKTRKKTGRPPGPLNERELAARKANAQLSTGPKTEAGKTASSRNAWKHGLNSAAAKQAFVNGADSLAQSFGKPCLTTCPKHPDNPDRTDTACGLVLDGMTHAGKNCLDKTVYVHAYAAILDGMEGAMDGMHAVLAAEGAAALQLIHQLRTEITTNGMSVPQYAINKNGDVVCRPGTDEPIVLGYTVNPLWGVLIGLLDKMGVSLPEMLATPQARSRAKINDDTADAMTTLLGTFMQRARAGSGAIGHGNGKPAIDHDR